MRNICLNNNDVNVFLHNIEPRFNAFREKIIKMASKNNVPFDDDVFMDTIITCTKTFSNQNATDNDVDNYFWVAFKQNSFSTFSINKFRNTVNFDDFGDDIIDDDYNADIDEIVDLIKSEVKNKFGDNIYEAWLLHVCSGYTYTELDKCGYEGLNLHNEFRQIKRFISNKVIQNNKRFKTLLIENNLI